MIDGLYAEYIMERSKRDSLWKDDAFVTFTVKEKELFIVDMYVRMEARMAGRGRELLEELERVAFERGCTIVAANIYLADPNSESTLKASLACGFKVVGAQNHILLISKEIEGGS